MYKYEEVYEKTLAYFDGDELAAKVFVDKYALRDYDGNFLELTPSNMHRRLAKEFVRIDKQKFKKPLTEQQVFELLDKFNRIVPQGSPMYGIGNPYQYVTVSNCYVLPSTVDSIAGILNTDLQIASISSRRGGVGFDISNLRPVDTSVKNAARTTSGAVSFMHRFSHTLREIAQNGRRAAGLVSISVHHPEVLDFIKIKQDLKSVTGMNISVQFSDEFMSAVKKNEKYEQRWPITGKNKISKEINARLIWDEFIKSCTNTAEPGAIWIDTIHRESTCRPYGEVESSANPCLSLSTCLLTKNGIRQLKDVVVGDYIWSSEGWTKVIKKFKTGVKTVYRYSTTFGSFLGTCNHKIVENGIKNQVKDANGIDILRGCTPSNVILSPSDIIDGLVIGDGSHHHGTVYLCIGEKDTDYFDSEIQYLIRKYRPGIHDFAYEINTTITKEELTKIHVRKIPDRFVYGNYNKICGFLRGLFSANGSICGGRITLKATSFEIVQSVQMMLNAVGIASYFTINKPKSVKFVNGEYLCKQSYDLNITRDKNKFIQHIGFIQEYKNDKCRLLNKNTCPRIENIVKNIITREEIGDEEVWDITVDNQSHTFWTNGCNVSNCGEQFLPPYACCRLVAINLFTYVKNPFTNKAYFDYDWFSQDVELMQRLADNMVDLDIECIDKIIAKIHSDPEDISIKRPVIDLWENIKQTTIRDRRTGCGYTALGDCIAALGIKYASDESIHFVEKMQKTFKLAAYSSSVEMAKEIGAFSLYNAEIDKQSTFIQRLAEDSPNLYQEMVKHGRRNMMLLTLAPCGSISCLTQTTSGIEPLFMMSYKRRKKGNPGDKDFRTDFVDQTGDHWMEFNVVHHKLLEWSKVNKDNDFSHSPYFSACAEDVDWVNRVKMQSVLNKHIDNSISVTINLPEDIKPDKVSEIYLRAYEYGCKGLTIYRKNCRSGVLVDCSADKVDKIVHTTAPKRPKDLQAKADRVLVKGQNYFVIVGLLDGQPYEVIAGKDKDNILEQKHSGSAICRKVVRGHYQLITDDKVIVDDITSHCEDIEEALTRSISTSLRHGANIQHVVEQLSKTKGSLTGFAKAIARVLKKYVPDGVKMSGANCPSCGDELIFQDGCCKCKSCSWSKC